MRHIDMVSLDIKKSSKLNISIWSDNFIINPSRFVVNLFVILSSDIQG